MYICISSTYYKHSNVYPISDWDEIGGEGGKGSPSSCLALQDYLLPPVCVSREREGPEMEVILTKLSLQNTKLETIENRKRIKIK